MAVGVITMVAGIAAARGSASGVQSGSHPAGTVTARAGTAHP